MFLLYLMMITYASVTTSSMNSIQEAKEYCLIETFHPKCSKNEVILMESAIYGRMKLGKCITAQEIQGFEDDPRFLGCSVDVRSLLDEKCSGKAECEVRVYDISDEKRQPCFSGLKMYLEASFRCISVADETRSCANRVSKAPIHVDVSKDVCGTESQPWTVEAPFGQKLIVSLLDLTPIESHKVNGNQCQQQGFIVDRAAKRNISICGVGSQRQKQLYTSRGNTIEIFINHQNKAINNPKKYSIFLKFEAVGCSDIVPSEDTWLKRKDDLIVIGCYSSRQTWKLNCNEGKWTGVIGNCSQDTAMSNSMFDYHQVHEAQLSHKAQVLAIVSICGFTLAICFTIMCIGALCLRRYYIQNKANSNYRTLNYESEFGRSNEMTGQRISSAFPTQYPGDIVKGLLAQQAPTYSVYSGQDGVDNTHNHLDQLRVINS